MAKIAVLGELDDKMKVLQILDMTRTILEMEDKLGRAKTFSLISEGQLNYLQNDTVVSTFTNIGKNIVYTHQWIVDAFEIYSTKVNTD